MVQRCSNFELLCTPSGEWLSSSLMPYYGQLGGEWVESGGGREVPILCHYAGRSFSSALVWSRYSLLSQRVIPAGVHTYCKSSTCNPHGARHPRSHCEFKAYKSAWRPFTTPCHRQLASSVTFTRNPVGRSSNNPKTATPGSVTKMYAVYFDSVMVRSSQQTQTPEASCPVLTSWARSTLDQPLFGLNQLTEAPSN
jgi:hypothetical protein